MKTINFMGSDRRCLSPVIASVFMILMVIVLASIVFLWARGFVGEQIEKFGEPIENYCGRVSFDAVLYNDNLEVKNSGNVDIRSFNIKKTRGGDTEFENFPFPVDAGKAEVSFIGSLEMDDGKRAEEKIVYPVLVGKVRGESRNSVFTCLDSGVTL